jgi:hypothetical protein
VMVIAHHAAQAYGPAVPGRWPTQQHTVTGFGRSTR